MRKRLALPVAFLLGSATMSAQGVSAAADDGDPWAVGYAVQVTRSCPAWQVEPQETLVARGVIPRPRRGMPLLELGGPFEREFYHGQAEADADRHGHPDFCRKVRDVAGARWPRLARVFRAR